MPGMIGRDFLPSSNRNTKLDMTEQNRKISTDFFIFRCNRPSEVLELLDCSDLFPDRLVRLWSCLVIGWEKRWSSDVYTLISGTKIVMKCSDWNVHSRYDCISWHYVFYFFGPGIYKTKPLTLQSHKRAIFCFELVAVCLNFLFTPQHCGGKTEHQFNYHRQRAVQAQDDQTENMRKLQQQSGFSNTVTYLNKYVKIHRNLDLDWTT